jgi:hypothetical protein
MQAQVHIVRHRRNGRHPPPPLGQRARRGGSLRTLLAPAAQAIRAASSEPYLSAARAVWVAKQGRASTASQPATRGTTNGDVVNLPLTTRPSSTS